MKYLPASLCLALLATLAQPAICTLAQTGAVSVTFPVKANKVLLDPARHQLYAILPDDNSVAVINTDMNTVAATLLIGSAPVDLAISPDGARLYVANSGSLTAGVGVVDLTTLTVLPSLAVSSQIEGIAAGLGDRLYLLSLGTEGEGANVAQVDAGTGDLQELFPLPPYFTADAGSLAMSPDYKTLFVYLAGLQSFDVSTATPVLVQEVDNGGGPPTISHNGLYLAQANESGTALLSATNLTAIFGTFPYSGYSGVSAFSTDDSKFYQVNDLGEDGYSTVLVFSTQTFTLLDTFALFTSDNEEGHPTTITSMAISAPNGYLYVAAVNGNFGAGYADLHLITTQTAAFFDGSVPLAGGFYFLQFASGIPFGYYSFASTPYLYHADLGFEYPIDAADGSDGIYLYDFTSSTYFYTSPALFPYLYDFTLDSFLYYYPNVKISDHYTAYPRYFFDFATNQIITK